MISLSLRHGKALMPHINVAAAITAICKPDGAIPAKAFPPRHSRQKTYGMLWLKVILRREDRAWPASSSMLQSMLLL